MSVRTMRSLSNLHARGDWVRLRTLVTLRWLAVIGQTTAVLVASQWLGFQLPLTQCALAISALVSFNLALQLVHPAETRLSESGTLGLLVFDLLQLVALLMLTGGLNNPFAVLILAPVTIAATALRMRSTIWIGVAGLLAIPLLSFVHLPLIDASGDALQVPALYRHGNSAALATGLVFLSLYARRVTAEGHAMSQALSATQLALAREQRLAAIGGIAAAAAHELGTPLATIKLVAGELADEHGDDPVLAEDIALIQREARRCGEIMADLSRGGRDDSHVRRAPVSAVIDEAASPHVDRGKQILVRIDGIAAHEVGDDQPIVTRSPEIIHGLRNLIQNAVDFASRNVWIDVGLREAEFRIVVGDDGPGYPPELLPRLGEPYVSTRARERSAPADRDEYEGMGLGLFIARTLLERSGGRVAFANGSDARQRIPLERDAAIFERPPGAIVEIVWPRELIVSQKRESRAPLGPNQRFDA